MREDGWYWVRSNEDWQIAYYARNVWFLMGSLAFCRDDGWSEIGERITRDGSK